MRLGGRWLVVLVLITSFVAVDIISARGGDRPQRPEPPIYSSEYKIKAISSLRSRIVYNYFLDLNAPKLGGIGKEFGNQKRRGTPLERPSRATLCQALLRRLDNLDGRAHDRFLDYLHRRFRPCFAIAELTDGLTGQASDPLMEWFDAGFLSQEVSATFPPEVIEQAQQQGEQAEGQILDVAILSDPSIFDDWMEVSVRVTTENSTHDYLVVFHLEAGDWKLFGTQLLD